MAQVQNGFGWRTFRALLRANLKSAGRKVLLNREFLYLSGERQRWLAADLNRFMALMKAESDSLRPLARLQTLPTTGNRIMVELSITTIAAYRVLCDLGIEPEDARTAIADTAWKIYGSQLALASWPFRLTTSDPAKRMRRTIRLMLRFPFSAQGAPGYAVKSWVDEQNIYTHFTHCPPQSFVREVIAAQGDRGELQAFAASWCRYDWPGADIIAGDGQRGHYERKKTLSAGDRVCDMCWRGFAGTEEAKSHKAVRLDS